MRKTAMAGMVAAGAIGAALAVGGVAYAAGDPSNGGEQIVRVVEDECPDKGGRSAEGTGDNL